MNNQIDKNFPHITRWTRPSSYCGATWPDYFSAGFGRSRDSDCLERSNFAVTLAQLEKLPPFVPPNGDDETESRIIVRESHWACGWVEWVAIHESDCLALSLCDNLARKVENYPALNENHWLELEDAEAKDVWQACYNDAERIKYIRRRRSQFEFRDFADLLSCARGKHFCGYASELIR